MCMASLQPWHLVQENTCIQKSIGNSVTQLPTPHCISTWKPNLEVHILVFYSHGCPRRVLFLCLSIYMAVEGVLKKYVSKVYLFRVCGSVYIKTCIYCAHLCGCIDVHVSRHVLLLIKACQHVHICCSILSTHTLLHILLFHVYVYTCQGRWRNMYAKVCIFRIFVDVYENKYEWSAQLCTCIDANVPFHVELLTKHVCMAVHTNTSTYASTYLL